MDRRPGSTRPNGAPTQIIGIAELDRQHGELVASLPVLPPKIAAIRLLGHARGLPGLATAPQTLFYHQDSLTHLVAQVMAPDPFTAHPALLAELLSLLESTLTRDEAFRRDDTLQATSRLVVRLILERAVRRDWDGSLGLATRFSSVLGMPSRFFGELPALAHDSRFEALFGGLRNLPVCRGMSWPYHLLDSTDLAEDAVLTVLVDTDRIPLQYQEAYLVALSVAVKVERTKNPGLLVIRSQDDRGEDLPLGDTLKTMVRESVHRALAVLGPSAQTHVAQQQVTIDVALRKPSPVEEIEGRSLLLPLVLVLARQLGEQLNLSARLDPSPSVVWTGDVDRHGSVRSVSGIPLKVLRVAASRARSFSFPEADHNIVMETLAGTPNELSLAPLTHVLDVSATDGLVTVTRRPWTTRAGFEIRRRARPLGVAGVVALGILLTALGFAVRNLASWLDDSVVSSRLAPSLNRVELLNSFDRVAHRFPVPHSSQGVLPTLGDIDGDGTDEVFTGTGSADSIPSSTFCYDQHGRLLWSFRGGFRPDEPTPGAWADYANTFNAGGTYVHDVDHDGAPDVFAVFNHTPYSATQIARLTSAGTYVSSFWNRGHCGSVNPMGRDLAFDDIDDDGYDEVLVAGTSNACGRAVMIILDPRSFRGCGHVCGGTDTVRAWQSYILLADPADIRHALEMPRTHSGGIEAVNWNGQKVIQAGVWLAFGTEYRGAFRYRLDRDLNVVDFYWNDWFALWANEAKHKGLLPSSWNSSRFREEMKHIEIIPGPQWLWEPDRGDGAPLPHPVPAFGGGSPRRHEGRKGGGGAAVKREG